MATRRSASVDPNELLGKALHQPHVPPQTADKLQTILTTAPVRCGSCDAVFAGVAELVKHLVHCADLHAALSRTSQTVTTSFPTATPALRKGQHEEDEGDDDAEEEETYHDASAEWERSEAQMSPRGSKSMPNLRRMSQSSIASASSASTVSSDSQGSSSVASTSSSSSTMSSRSSHHMSAHLSAQPPHTQPIASSQHETPPAAAVSPEVVKRQLDFSRIPVSRSHLQLKSHSERKAKPSGFSLDRRYKAINANRTPCPHCGRKFASSAALRHIDIVSHSFLPLVPALACAHSFNAHCDSCLGCVWDLCHSAKMSDRALAA